MNPHILINFGFKEHTGRSTMNAIFAFLLGRMKERTLLIDLDPSMTSTKIISKTKKINVDPENTIYTGLNQMDLNRSIIKVNDSLSIIPGDWRINLWSPSSEKREENSYISEAISNLKYNFKYIIIDMPNIESNIASNALRASTNVFLTLENQRSSYTSFTKDVQYLTETKHNFKMNYAVSGILLYITRSNPSSKENQLFINDAKSKFGGAIMSNPMWFQERIKSFTEDGISSNGIWDNRVLTMYQNILNEELTRIEE